MSYFEDQEDAWFENDCKGSIEDYNPFDPDSWPRGSSAPIATAGIPASTPKLTKSQKRNAQRKRAKAAKRAAHNVVSR